MTTPEVCNSIIRVFDDYGQPVWRKNTYCLLVGKHLHITQILKPKMDEIIFTLSISVCAYVNNSKLIQPFSHTF
jgi:hypothetical protein